MKDKHIYIAQDSDLLKLIYRRVDEALKVNTTKFTLLLWVKFFVYLPLAAVLYAALFTLVNPIAFIGCFIAYGFIFLLFAFNFSHDFAHNTIFKTKKLNNFCFILIYSMVGAHAEAWKYRHVNSHHYAPNVEGYDSDLKISKLIRVIPNSDYEWYHRFQYYYAPIAYTCYSLFWIFVKNFVILFSMNENNKKKYLTKHVSFWFQKLFYATLMIFLPMKFSHFPWYTVLIAFLLMHIFQSLFLLLTFFMTHHVEKTAYPTTDKLGYINTSWLMNQIKSSNDMHPFSEPANFILGGFNNHIAHHLFPHVHHIYYPELNKILYKVLIENGITPNQTSYWGGIVSHMRLLKKMGER
jgi:linoleoyl-CoA desaturase